MSLFITDIIQRLEYLSVVRPEKLGRLKSPDLLINVLKDLDSIVEMEDAKESICLQLQYIIIKIFENDNYTGEIFDDHMLHTVISGPPGVGKTQLGKALAQIWYCLGILKGKRLHLEVPEHTYRNFVSQFETTVNNINSQITDVVSLLNNTIITLNNCYYDPEPIVKSIKKYQSNLRKIITQNTVPSFTVKVPDNDAHFRIATRADFVGKFVGHTAPKTLALLESCIGGVLFIDEAYSLINCDRDSFGMEALTELNRFMSEHPNELIVIFAGYKNLLDDTIFKAQPGLKRRCTWVFDIESYTPTGLSDIFQKQLAKHGWSIDPNIDLVKLFTNNKDNFPNFGGDTNRLIFYCKLYHVHNKFIELTKPYVPTTPEIEVSSDNDSKKRKRQDNGKNNAGNKKIKLNENSTIHDPNIISEETLTLALTKYLQNQTKNSLLNEAPFGMYL